MCHMGIEVFFVSSLWELAGVCGEDGKQEQEWISWTYVKYNVSQIRLFQRVK